MRFISLLTTASIGLFLAACAGTGSPSGAIGQSVDCADMIVAGSPLYGDVTETKVERKCTRRADLAGHKATTYIAAGKLAPSAADVDLTDPTMDFAPRIAVFIARFDENVTPLDNQMGMNEDFVGRKLDSQIPVTIAGHQTNGDVLRMDEKKTEITLACVTAVVPGKAGTPTKVGICRSLGRGSSDDRVIRKAKAIAEHDLPAIDP